MNEEYGKGHFLIANPVLPDRNFSRPVVLLCDHNEEGSFGLVVNRRTNLKTSEVFPENDFFKASERPVFAGGPVSSTQVFYLCRSQDPLPGLDRVCEGIYMGMSRDALEKALGSIRNPETNIRFYMGYSGWGAGQLACEMEQRSWLTCVALESLVFEEAENKIWHDAVRSLGKEYEYLLQAPLDPSQN